MNAQELRIGNLINVFRKPQDKEMSESTVIEIFIDNDEYFCRLDDGFVVNISTGIKPIPLTEEWLLRFGFEKINHIHGYSFYTLSKSKKNKCHIDIYDTHTKYMGYSVNHCQYVHQLQNLYFALTGEELTIK